MVVLAHIYEDVYGIMSAMDTSNVTKAPVTQPTASSKSYLPALLLAIGVPMTGLSRIYTGHRDGKFRFAVLVSDIIIMIAFVGLVCVLAAAGQTTEQLPQVLQVATLIGLIYVAITVPILILWGIIDFFLALHRTTDATGLPLASTERDTRWARRLYWLAVSITLAQVAIAIAGSIFFSQVKIDTNTLTPPYNTQGSQHLPGGGEVRSL